MVVTMPILISSRQHRIIHDIWYPPSGKASWFVRPLVFLSFIYGNAVRLRNNLYNLRLREIKKLPCRVISIGNLTVGGTGKTPLVIETARRLQSLGLHPAVLSRGYGGTSPRPVNIVSDGAQLLMDPEEAGDEPVLMARSLRGVPVLTGPRRYLTGREALSLFRVDALVLDDAFQHRRLHRDVDVVLIDEKRGLGNGYLLPLGPLREPLSALRRAQVIVLTSPQGQSNGQVEAGTVPWLPPGVPVFSMSYRLVYLTAADGTTYPVEEALRGKRVLAFAGIANPDSFRETLIGTGVAHVSFLAFPDHHRYTGEDLKTIENTARREKVEMIVTTEKDEVKLTKYGDFLKNVYMLPIQAAIETDGDRYDALIGGRDKA